MPTTSATERHPYGLTAGSGNAAWQRAGTAASAAKRNLWARVQSPDLTPPPKPMPRDPRDWGLGAMISGNWGKRRSQHTYATRDFSKPDRSFTALAEGRWSMTPNDYWQMQALPRTELLRAWDAKDPAGIAKALERFSPVYVQGLEEIRPRTSNGWKTAARAQTPVALNARRPPVPYRTSTAR